MIELALHYAKSGWPVFPLAAGGKEPAIPKERGGHGCHDATLDLNRIEQWWHEYPSANVGIATGRRSGLLVIDVDPRKCARWLESLHALALPPTFTVKTWSGGWHLYFKFSGDPRITIGTNLLPAIDWRATGGYVVGAGSTVEGVTYEIAKNLPIAVAPTALLERIAKHRKCARPMKDKSGHMVIPDGARNETLFALACLLRRFGIEYNAIYQSLRATNEDHCNPPTDDEELRQIAASAMRYAPENSPKESA
ncbi:MAG TPA: bifunctional DNA primase/polymerase [Steroidobacteraceae bacterium]|nr:bifunctional DNA primase/polymerase [Steroidobacteraceae bacterium]